MLLLILCANNDSLTNIKSKCTSLFSWSARGPGSAVHFLSFFRPDKTTLNPIIKPHRHPPRSNHRLRSFAIYLDDPEPHPKALFLLVQHNPPANHPQHPFPTVLPPARQQSATHPPIPALAACAPPSLSHTTDSDDHSLTDALSAFHRPGALDGNPFRWRFGIGALPARH